MFNNHLAALFLQCVRPSVVVFVYAYIAGYTLARRWREAGIFALGLGPLTLLQVILWRIFGTPAFFAGPPFERLPFLSLFLSHATRMGMFAQVVVVLVPALLLTGYSVFLLWRGDRRPLVWALLFNGLLLFFVTHYAWRELIASARISLGLVVATLALAALRRDRQCLMLFGSWWLITNSLYVLITQDKVL